MNIVRLFASFSGRIPRSSYWLGFAAVVLVFGLGRYGLKQWLGMETPSPDDLVVTIWTLLAMVPLTALIVKRFNDRDRPAWIGYAVGAATAFSAAAPYFGFLDDPANYTLAEHVVLWSTLPLSVFALVDNGFLRGTPGPNRYGPQPGAQIA